LNATSRPTSKQASIATSTTVSSAESNATRATGVDAVRNPAPDRIMDAAFATGLPTVILIRATSPMAALVDEGPRVAHDVGRVPGRVFAQIRRRATGHPCIP
jgi:hypothetical protein